MSQGCSMEEVPLHSSPPPEGGVTTVATVLTDWTPRPQETLHRLVWFSKVSLQSSRKKSEKGLKILGHLHMRSGWCRAPSSGSMVWGRPARCHTRG